MLAEEEPMARRPARLPNGTRISDYVSLGVLTTTVPATLVDAVLADTGRQSRRYRQLPARLVVYYVMALAIVCAGLLWRGPALPPGGRALAAPGRQQRGRRRQVGDHQGAHPARRCTAPGPVPACRPSLRRTRDNRRLVSRPSPG